MRIISGAALVVFAFSAVPAVSTPASADSAIVEERSTEAPTPRVDEQPAADPAPVARVQARRAPHRTHVER